MSALSKLEKLMYTIGVVDKATGPVNKIMGKINQLSEQTRTAQDQIMRGFITAGSSGLALANSLSPAIDHVAALGEVQSLGVADEALSKLTKTSFEFSAQFGGNSAEFVRSAYDIQSAISGLEGVELSAFTKASNILAVATKADASTITSYMGTMYGIFEQTANKMGKSDWVNQIAGQTAKAVQMYKTTGSEMQAAFSALGAKATMRGANSAQQMAVLGELQLVLKSGSVAGTNYASFIDGIGKAEKALNISLTDKNGDMLGMDTMLGRINDKLKGIGSIAKGDILNQAFGSKTAASVVDILSTKVNKLTTGTDELNNVSDASKAIEMANIIASPWDRLSGTFNAAATAMGQRLLPVVEPFIEMLATAFNGVVNLTEQFPILSSVIATVVVSIVALITVFGLVTMSMGIYRYAMITLSATTSILSNVTKVWTAAIWLQGKALAAAKWAAMTYQQALFITGVAMSHIKNMGFIGILNMITQKTKSAALATFNYNKAMVFVKTNWAAFSALVESSGSVFAALKVVFMSAARSVMAFNSALLINPIGWIVAGVILLAVVIYKFWQPIKAFMSGFWEGFKHGFTPVIDIFSALFSAFGFLGDVFSAAGNVLSWFGTQIGFTSETLGGFTNAGVLFGEVLAAAFRIVLFPVTSFIKLVTFAINLLSDLGSWVKDLFGFGDDINITTNKTVDHVVTAQGHKLVRNRDIANQTRNSELHSNNVSNTGSSLINNQLAGNSIAFNSKTHSNVIGFNNHNLVSKSDLTTLQLVNNKANSMSTNNTIAHNKTDLATLQLVSNKVNSISSNNAISDNKAEFATLQLVNNKVNSMSTNNTIAHNKTDPVSTYSNASLNNVYALNQSTENIEQYQKDNESLVTNSSRKIEKSAFLQQLTSNSSSNNKTNNNTDNSKRVFIDNLTLKSDDVANSFEQLMEVAG